MNRRKVANTSWHNILPRVSEGDKRTYWINGEVLGTVNRIPQQGSYLADIHQGAISVTSEPNTRVILIINQLTQMLQNNGIFMAGLDFIDAFLTEVNITSPSALRQINMVS